MPKDKLEVAVPSRPRSMKGWVMVSGEAKTVPALPVALVSERNILSGQRRSRLQTEQLDYCEPGAYPGFKRKASSGAGASTIEKQHRRIQKGVRPQRNEHDQLRREITRLKLRNNLTATSESQEIRRLQAEVKRLARVKTEQTKIIDRLRSGALPFIERSNEDEDETETKRDIIHDLKSDLSRALEFKSLLTRFQDVDLPSAAASIERVMKDIELGVIRSAELLYSCSYPVAKMPSSVAKHSELGHLIKRSIKNTQTLHSAPDLAFRALLFCIIQDSILHSDMWTALHTEGLMLRGYQSAIRDMSPPNFLTTFHKAALHHTLNHDPSFETTFLAAHAEELRLHTIDLLSPLLEASLTQQKTRAIAREMDSLFRDAFSFRARCLAPDGVRFEVVQFGVGEPFDGTLMEAQDECGMRVPVPYKKEEGGKGATIKLCVHGMVVARKVPEEELSGLQRIKALGQPFLFMGEGDGDGNGDRGRKRSGTAQAQTPRARRVEGEMVSGKAIVILND
ncbi:hypothetical protein BDV06DRAFT_188259 [Aspergillus oleicola]